MMRLLYRMPDGELGLQLFMDDAAVPPYAILSHRWVEDEPDFQDIMNGTGTHKTGYLKLKFCAEQSAKDQLKYFWVDTVCIDKKTDPMELSEALNSMFRWYRDAVKCYVHMADVESREKDFHKSNWFTRGWTLQELIAPKVVEFYDSDGSYMGTKESLEQEIHAITGIPVDALRGRSLSSFTTAERFSWAQNRITTRKEDKAYCLLGIFEIFMPPIYGEQEQAFDRLIQEVERRYSGQTYQTIVRLRQKFYNEPEAANSPIEYTLPITPPTTPPTEDVPDIVEDHRKVKNSLFDAEVQSRSDKIKPFKSSSWLFDHDTFKAWEGGDSDSIRETALITLRGNPGTGKSVLINEAAKRAKSQGFTTLYHRFDRVEHGKTTQFKTPLGEFCVSILYQLMDLTRPQSWNFTRKWAQMLQDKPTDTPWSISGLQDSIHEIISSEEGRGMSFRVFVDALEESCDDEGGIGASQPLDILSFISDLLRTTAELKVDVRVCISRQHLPNFDGLEPKTRTIIVEDHNTPALKAYISNELLSVEDKGLRYILRSKIMERCTNDFLWATTVVQGVISNVKSTEEATILGVVDELPRTHKEMYRRILDTGQPWTPDGTLRILQLVSGARRPLTVDEFRHALAFSTDAYPGDIEGWERSGHGFQPGEIFENYIRRESHGLVEIHHGPQSEKIVRFIHGSVDSFLRDPTSALPEEALPWDKRCDILLLKMSLRSLDSSSLRDKEPIEFVPYACDNWVHHARECGDFLQEVEELPDFLQKCSKRKAKRVIQRQIAALKQSSDRAAHLVADEEPLFVLLASKGCSQLLQRHLSDCAACRDACTTYDSTHRKAIENALIGRWTDTAMLLFTASGDGDINALNNDKTLLYRACYFRQKDVVAFLLNNNADPLVHSPSGYEYPLHAAIELAQSGLISILLQHGKVEEQFRLRRRNPKYKGSTALHMVFRTRKAPADKLVILKLLLKYAPRSVGILDVKDDNGVSVLALAEEMREHEDPKIQDMVDEIEEFADEEEDV